MTTKYRHDNPILVTGAAGAVGGIGRNLTEFLLARGHKVRALVRREDERAEALRRLGAEVVEGDLTDLASMHRAIEGCARMYFGMSVSAAYLEATVNTAAVARHHGVEAFLNMSQMTVTQMSIIGCTLEFGHNLVNIIAISAAGFHRSRRKFSRRRVRLLISLGRSIRGLRNYARSGRHAKGGRRRRGTTLRRARLLISVH